MDEYSEIEQLVNAGGVFKWVVKLPLLPVPAFCQFGNAFSLLSMAIFSVCPARSQFPLLYSPSRIFAILASHNLVQARKLPQYVALQAFIGAPEGFQQFCEWYFKLISMRDRRRLQFDRDQQSFTPHVLLSSLENTPESLTFDAVSESRSRNRLKGSREANTLKITYNEHSAAEVTYSPSLQSHADLYSERTLKQAQTMPGHRRSTLLGLSGEQERTLDRQLDQMHQKISDSKGGTCKLIFENNNILEGIIRSQKIKKLQDMFIKKIRRTSTAATPVHFTLFSSMEGESILGGKGVEVPQGLSNFLNVLSVLQILCLLFIYSVSITFQDLMSENSLVSTLQMSSLLFYLIEIGLNLVSIKSQAGKKVEVIEDIVRHYLGRSFWVDVVSFVILLLDISTSLRGMSYLRLFIVFKLPACLVKIEKLEVHFIRNIYNEQYWQLAKVFLVNFCMAHVICILLAGMTRIDSSNNWMVAKGVANAGWTQRYIWSYYWAANIMLTVGFGDIVASNSTEAICLIFIETFSCIVMAYNINCMGAILTSIRAENERRSKKFKIFKKLTTNNYVPEELEFQINNYIEESSNLKKKFNYEEDKEFISQLPQTLRVSYLREANRTVLRNLVFFRDLLDRTLYNFAEHLEVRMTHPQETIRHIDDDFNLMILKEGEVGYSCKKHGCGFNDEIVDYIRVRAGESPFLTSLDFISKLRPLYEIKSLKFSELYQLSYSRFIEVFRESDMDYELFCFLRDKIRNIPDQFQVLPCEYCGKKFNHFKFTCPKLHYTPYPQHTIDKELHREKVGRNPRASMHRCKQALLTPVEFYKKLKNYRASPKVGVQYDQRVFYEHFYQEGVKKVEKRNSTLMSEEDGRRGTRLSEDFCQEDLHDLIDIKAREAIEVQFLRKQQMEEFQDELWMLRVDVLADFNSYFSQNNPQLLREKFTPEKRMHQKMEKIYNLEKVHLSLAVPQVATDAIKSLIGYTPSEKDNAPN